MKASFFLGPHSGGFAKGSNMHKIEDSAGHVVANDTQKSVASVDQAVVSLANLCASIVEVSTASNLPIATAQSALAHASAGLSNLVASREDMAAATREIIRVQKASTLSIVNFGCPNGLPQPSGMKPDQAVGRSETA